MKIVVSGSTGLVGSALQPVLVRAGHDVVPLVRRPPAPGERAMQWNPARGTIDRAGLEGADAVIHLAGENVFGRWTPAKKNRIRDSRVLGTQLVSDALAGLNRRPRTLLAASAVGYYGDRGDEMLTEHSAPGEDFLAHVSREWEAATGAATRAGIRVVNLRFGIVLTATGGALAKMLPPFRLGLGGHIGSGNQYVSWIAMDDVLAAIVFALSTETLVGPVNMTSPNPVTNRELAKALGKEYVSWIAMDDVLAAIVFALSTETLVGPVNMTSPNPVTNRELAKALGKVLGRPAIVAVPSFALRMAFGPEGAGMLQSGQRVLPERLRAAGFRYRHETIEATLRDELVKPA